MVHPGVHLLWLFLTFGVRTPICCTLKLVSTNLNKKKNSNNITTAGKKSQKNLKKSMTSILNFLMSYFFVLLKSNRHLLRMDLELVYDEPAIQIQLLSSIHQPKMIKICKISEKCGVKILTSLAFFSVTWATVSCNDIAIYYIYVSLFSTVSLCYAHVFLLWTFA